METRLAVTHCKDSRMFPLYDNSLDLLPQTADSMMPLFTTPQPPRRLWPKTVLWARRCWSGLRGAGGFYRILSGFPCVCGVARRNILQGCRCFWQRVTDLFRCCILQSGPVNPVCLVLLYTLWKTGRIPNSGLIKPLNWPDVLLYIVFSRQKRRDACFYHLLLTSWAEAGKVELKFSTEPNYTNLKSQRGGRALIFLWKHL